MSTLEPWVKLSHTNLLPRTQRRLVEHFGDPRGIFTATDKQLLAVAGVREADVTRVRNADRDFNWATESEKLEAAGATVLTLRDDGYPRPLLNIPDPPVSLFVRGEWREADERSLALVGTRRASNYGRIVAEELAAALAQRGFTVVSGMAAGIDTMAHRGALSVSGRTAAIFGCGIDVIYPRQNRDLARDIAVRGALLSEYPCGVRPEPWRFPARNRLISGLTLGTVVIEAPENSGALITADFAGEQGRDVFAVPGSIKSGRSRGCHRLLQDGAKLVDCVEDILDELRIELPSAPSESEPETIPDDLSPNEQCVLRVLPFSETHIDEITRLSGLSPADTNASLMLLEVKGLVRRLPGSMFLRVR